MHRRADFHLQGWRSRNLFWRHLVVALACGLISTYGEGGTAAVSWGDSCFLSLASIGIGLGLVLICQRAVDATKQRLHTRDNHPETGITLAIWKRIVKRHGCCIWVVPERDKGTRFSLNIAANSPALPAP